MTKPDQFAAHEALHTAYLLTEIFSRHLAEHPFVVGHPDLAEQADAIGNALGTFYQAIGAASADTEA